MKIFKSKMGSLWIACAASALLLAACGGSDTDRPTTTTPAANDPTVSVPATASQSDAGLVDYLKALVKADADDKQPVSLKGFTPTSSDDAEPEPVGG